MEKKDFDIDPTSQVAAAPEETSDGDGSQPRRKKRTGLRVPSDNVPRPDARSTGRITMPPDGSQPSPSPAASQPAQPAVRATVPLGSGISTLNGPPPAPVAAVPVPELSDGVPRPEAVGARTGEDLEVDVEMVDLEDTPPPTRRNGSGPYPSLAAADRAATAADPVEDLTEQALEAPPGPRTIEQPAVEPPPDDADGEAEQEIEVSGAEAEEDVAEPTLIGPPPTSTIPLAATSQSAPTPVAATSAAPPAPVVATPPMTPPPPAAAAPAPVAAPAPPVLPSIATPIAQPISATPTPSPTNLAAAFTSVATPPQHAPETDASAAGAPSPVEDAEELSPAEFEEVESGPTSAAAARAATPVPAAAAPAASTPAVTPPAAPAQAAPATTPQRTNAPPPPPPPAPAARTTPPAAPAPAAATQAVAAQAAAAGQPRVVKKRKGKAWYEEIFDEDYLRTLPFLTPQATQREAAFIADALALKPGMQVLDLGCGYGRHAMELAARAYHVVGLDLSLPLLIRGADEAQRRGLNINFVHGDMRELTFDAQFDGAYCVFSTFGYFDDETNKRVAHNLARALKPGGRLVVDVLNRDYVIGDLPTRVWWEGDGCVVLEEVDFNYFTSRVISNRSVVFEDGRQLEQEISLRAYSLHELGKLLHSAGFRVIEVSGGLATRGRFFGNESRQIIVVAEKRADSASGTPTSGPGEPPR